MAPRGRRPTVGGLRARVRGGRAPRFQRRRLLREHVGLGWARPRCGSGIQLLLRRAAVPTRLGLHALAALGCLGAWMLLSASWGMDGTEATREAERCAVYVAGLAALLLIARPSTSRALLSASSLEPRPSRSSRSGSASSLRPRSIRTRDRCSRSPSGTRTPSGCSWRSGSSWLSA